MKQPAKSEKIDTSLLYRMPWTMSDNAFTWLEPTRECNMSCEYCYQRNDPNSKKSIEKIEIELECNMKLRKCDTMIIAGGEPLIHPEIIEICRMVKFYKVKPVILTNGLALTKDLLRSLKKAGVFGFAFHIDSHQNRPGWEGKNEKDLNVLRQKYADMVYEEGGLVCSFNTTIVPKALKYVPDIVKWTTDNIHKVASNVLITVRTAHKDDLWDYYAGVEKLEIEKTPYSCGKQFRDIKAFDICEEIWKVHPDYSFHSFLGGTVSPDVPKWLFGTHIGSKNRIYGNLGPLATEIIQSVCHLIKRKYLSFTSKMLNNKANILMPVGLVDKNIRKAFIKRLITILKNPVSMFERLHIQSLIVMQPHDILENGEQDECDGCPNKTYWNGRLVSECRQEDYLLYGRPITSIRKSGIKRNLSSLKEELSIQISSDSYHI